MIVIMQRGASAPDIENVITHLEKEGYRTNVSRGENQTVIGIIGTIDPSLSERLEAMTGVEQTVRVSKPYKLASRDFHPLSSVIEVGDGRVQIGSGQTIMMAGPCTVETEKQLMETAEFVAEQGAVMLRGGAYKPSTSPYGFRGLGPDGLKLLAKASQRTGLPVITEVLTPSDVPLVAEYADVLQIGTRNMQNYILLDEVGKTKKPVMLKRGMSARVEEWLLAAEYVLSGGNPNVILCERGIRTFETAVRNTLDLAIVPLIKRLSHLPVIVDPSQGTGKWYLVTPSSLAAVAVGADGLIVEVHPNPDVALKDGAQSLSFENFRELMDRLPSVASSVNRPLAKMSAAVAAKV